MNSLELIQKYFVNRTDVLPVSNPGFNHRGLPTDETLEAHLAGRLRAGVHTTDPKTSMVKWACFDFDQHEKDGVLRGLADPLDVAISHQVALEKLGLVSYLETSGGGRGFHVWVFFDEPLPAAMVRKLRYTILPGLGLDGAMTTAHEFFPKQDAIGLDDFGNLVWLPWWGGAAEGGNVFVDEIDGDIKTNTRAELDAAIVRIKVPVPKATAASSARGSSDPDPLDVRLARFSRLLAASPYESRPAIGGDGEDGYPWSIKIFLLAGDLLTPDEAIESEALQEWADSCDPPWERDEMYRKLRETAHEFTDLAYSGDKEAPPTPEDFDDVSDWLAEQNDLVEPANDNGGLPPTAEQILRSMYARPLPERAQTGIPELDAITGGGLIPGNLVFICAPPGSGKTGFVIFQGVTFEAAGRPVVLAEMELSQEETAARVASQHTRVAVRAVVEDRTPEAQAATLAAVSGKNIFVLADRPKIRDIERAIVAVRTKFGKSPVLIVDFLQQMPSDDQRQDARTAVGTTAYALKAMAEKHGCCCLVVSSVARDRYGSLETDDPRAWLAFAKESGDVEFSAGVLSVLEVGEFDPATGESAGRLVIAKNRHGQTGFVGLRFHGASGAWRADPTAVAEFGEDARKAKNGAREHGKAVRKDVDDDRQLWGQLKKIGTVTRSKFKNAASKGGNRDEVKAQWGMSPEAALEAFDRLVASGRISVTDEVVQTPGGSQKAKVARAVDLEWPIGTEAAS